MTCKFKASLNQQKWSLMGAEVERRWECEIPGATVLKRAGIGEGETRRRMWVVMG